MPLYEYECLSCGIVHEIMQKFADAPMEICPQCGGNVRKLISMNSFQLKGSGWYVTDYASKGKRDDGKTHSNNKNNQASDAGSNVNDNKSDAATSKPEATNTSAQKSATTESRTEAA